MSHVTKINLKIRDLDALAEACAAVGLEFRRDQKTHAWWGNFVGDSTPPRGRDPKDYGKCDHAIGRPGMKGTNGSNGEWEIGVVKALDGDGYDLLVDTFGSAGKRITDPAGGRDFGKLRQEYAAAVALAKAKTTLARKGFVASREQLAGGRIKLRLRKR